MSLIRVRRERRELGLGARKGSSLRALALLLATVLALIWYLGHVGAR